MIFRCKIGGDPKPTIEWSKGKWSKLQHGGRVKIYHDSKTGEEVLEMTDIKSKDAGTYTVTITNEHGTESAPATLMVTDKEEEDTDWKSALKHR